MYADDTTMYFNLEDFTNLDMENEINDEIEKITIWLKVNKLSSNVQKTKLMIFHRKQKHIQNLNISINGLNIERVESFNFLGITLQETLSWDSHVTLVKTSPPLSPVPIILLDRHNYCHHYVELIIIVSLHHTILN